MGQNYARPPVGEHAGTLVVVKRFFVHLAVWGRFVVHLRPLLGSFGVVRMCFIVLTSLLGAPGSFEGSIGAVLGQDETLLSST